MPSTDSRISVPWVQVKAAQKQLLGLAAARVLTDEQTRHQAQDLLGVGNRAQLDVQGRNQLLLLAPVGGYGYFL